MALVDCRKCNGTKKTAEMGGMKVKCETCKGVGKIEKIDSKPLEDRGIGNRVTEPLKTQPVAKAKRRKAVQLVMPTPDHEYE